MKKSILKFGTVVATITSMISMIACNTNIDNENKKTQPAKQDKINSIVEGDLTWVSPDSTKLPSEITNYGTTLPNATIKGVSGLLVTFTRVSHDDAAGSITIKATIKKTGYTNKEITKVIIGFRTTRRLLEII